MASVLRRRALPTLLVAASISALAQAQSYRTYPLDNVPGWQEDSSMTLQMSAPSGGIALNFVVVPFTRSAGLNLTEAERGAINIHGTMVVATESTYADITSSNSVAYLSCDQRNNSLITSEMMLSTLMDNKPKAILLYSQQGSCCGLTGISDSTQYRSIFSMTDVAEAAEALNITNSGVGWVQATISGNVTGADSDGSAGQTGNNSAVAMSILYSITGLITLLFLVIIATGAIRAHRYPDRYGPRSGYGGRPRQSRAKGIARAVLDTLPIVKFGTPEQLQKPDPAMELEDGPTEQQQKRRGGTSPDTVQAHHLSTIPEDAEAIPSGRNEPTRESRVPPAGAAAATATQLTDQTESRADPVGDEHLGCSICTDDFLVGEDVRVLPCDHKFHPPCIDPWLINVSGTCPLCRLDLNPPKNADDDGSDAGDDSMPMPPPLGSDEQDGNGSLTSTSNSQRRSSRFFDLNRLRHASVEERIEVLRRYRSESGADDRQPNEEERSRTSRLTQRLRDRFRVRTRAQSPRQVRQSLQNPDAATT